MAEVLLFHHAQGRTDGVLAFAERLRQAGHTVHAPDLYDGRTFGTVEEGVSHARSIGFSEIGRRSAAEADGLPADIVYAGFSLGAAAAEELAQTRPGAGGALLFHGCVPTSEFGTRWPDAVPVQIHAAEHDPFFVDDGDIEAARGLVEKAADGELFLYPGDQHLFADSSLSSYDPPSAELLVQRVLAFLDAR